MVQLILEVMTDTASRPISADDAIAIDVFSFGLDRRRERLNVNNAIYRLELEEDGDNSSDFIGTLEYIGLNQINILGRRHVYGHCRH